MFLTGTLVNAGAVLVATSLGTVLRRGIPERVRIGVMNAMGLFVLYIGIDGIVSYAGSAYAKGAGDLSVVSLILSLALGAALGSAIGIEHRIDLLGKRLTDRFSDGSASFARGFLNCSLLFCVGAMSIVGEIRGGMFGDHRMIWIKAAIDAVAGFTMASTLGAGCILSAATVLVYQGLIAGTAYLSRGLVARANADALAGLADADRAAKLSQILDAIPAMNQMNLIGSILMIALALNMLGVSRFRVADLLPALFLPFLFCLIPIFR
jgi:uncharacterized membrane protein YqgA involved in biofilm formation